MQYQMLLSVSEVAQ